MLYPVGSRIDLRDAQEPAEAIREVNDKYLSGTKISFIKMAKGFILMNVVEPPIALSVAIRA